jgi:hypothetical protein
MPGNASRPKTRKSRPASGMAIGWSNPALVGAIYGVLLPPKYQPNPAPGTEFGLKRYLRHVLLGW